MSGQVKTPHYCSSVMFVCLGNIIRSPICEGLLRYRTNNIVVDSSAVTEDDLNCRPHKHAQRIAKEHGFNISNHISKLITNDDFYKFDLVVGLEDYVVRCLNRMKPKDSKALVVKFAPFNVFNPWCNPYADFVEMYAQIEEGMKMLIQNYINPANVRST